MRGLFHYSVFFPCAVGTITRPDAGPTVQERHAMDMTLHYGRWLDGGRSRHGKGSRSTVDAATGFAARAPQIRGPASTVPVPPGRAAQAGRSLLPERTDAPIASAAISRGGAGRALRRQLPSAPAGPCPAVGRDVVALRLEWLTASPAPMVRANPASARAASRCPRRHVRCSTAGVG